MPSEYAPGLLLANFGFERSEKPMEVSVRDNNVDQALRALKKKLAFTKSQLKRRLVSRLQLYVVHAN